MNKSTLHEMFGCETKIQIPRSIWFPALLRWALVLAVLIVPQAGRALEWHATVGAQSGDKGRQALAFLPNEIWIHAGDSITWTIDVDERPYRNIHTRPRHPAAFLSGDLLRRLLRLPLSSFDGSTAVSSTRRSRLQSQREQPSRYSFPKTGNFKLVCLFHENMTGVVHVLETTAPLPHDQDFYDRQAADQRRDLLSDRDGRLVAAGEQHGECAARDSLKARVVTAGIGEISATAGGTQTLSVVRFIGDKIQIRAGDTVEWTNQDPVTPHTVTFGTEPANIFAPSPDPPTRGRRRGAACSHQFACRQF